MRILVDCRPLVSFNGEKLRFIIFCANILSKNEGIEWLFLMDQGEECPVIEDIPKESLIFRKAFRGGIGRKFRDELQLRAVIKRYDPGLLMLTGGEKKKRRFSIPQYWWDWEKTGPGAALKEYEPLSIAEREIIKQEYADGKEYFFTMTDGLGMKEQIDLLKAFSLFKKRQRSNIRLILAGKGAGGDSSFREKLTTYKYREDVHVFDLGEGREFKKLLAGAYAFIFPPREDSLGLPLFNSWQARVPVILLAALTGKNILQERGRRDAKEALLIAFPGDPASLAAQLMTVYKDEAIRGRLIEKGTARVGELSWEKAAQRLWKEISNIYEAGQSPQDPEISREITN